MKKYIFTIGITLFLLTAFLSGCLDDDVNINRDIEKLSIINFNVKPSIINQGGTANLSWNVTGASSVTIDNGIGNVGITGTRIIAPNENTNYTITAYNSTSSISATTYIIVKKDMGDENQDTDIYTPFITFTKDESVNTLTVVQGVPVVNWSDININVTYGSNQTYYVNKNGQVLVGDFIDFDGRGLYGDITIRFTYKPNNGLIGTYKMSDVYP